MCKRELNGGDKREGAGGGRGEGEETRAVETHEFVFVPLMLCAQERVRRRIPLFNINAYMYNTLMSRCTRTNTTTESTLAHAPNNNTVEHAVQLHHPPPTHIMETEPALGRDNLFLVRWRHGNDPVRQFNTALQKLDLSVVEQSVKEGAIGQPKVPRFRHPEIPCASAE